MIHSLCCRIGKKEVRVIVKGSGDAELELWAAKNQVSVFEDVFGREVRFDYTS